MTQNSKPVRGTLTLIERFEMERLGFSSLVAHVTAVNLDDALKQALKERDAALAECQEQARLNGMGASREAKLMAERDAALEKLKVAEEMLKRAAPYVGLMKNRFKAQEDRIDAARLQYEIQEALRKIRDEG